MTKPKPKPKKTGTKGKVATTKGTPPGVVAAKSSWREVRGKAARKLRDKLRRESGKLLEVRRADDDPVDAPEEKETTKPEPKSSDLFMARSRVWKKSITQLAQIVFGWAARNKVNPADAMKWAMAFRSEEDALERMVYLKAIFSEIPAVRDLVTLFDPVSTESGIASMFAIVAEEMQGVTDLSLIAQRKITRYKEIYPGASWQHLRLLVCERGHVPR